MDKLEQFLEKRAFKRKPSNIRVIIYYRYSVYYGTVTNLSGNGMFISTNKIMCPLQSKFEIFIPSVNSKVLKLHIKVSRLAKTDSDYIGFGVELLNVPKDYLALVK